MGNFILTLLHAATNGHILHLQSRSLSEHLALKDYYEGLPDLVDTLAEQLQGLEQAIIEYDYDYFKPANTALDEVQDVYDFVQANRYSVSENTSIQATIDDIEKLIQSTLNKLRFLK